MAEFADAGLAVLNISFGAITKDDEPPLVLTRAVEALRGKAVTVVAAAGNGARVRTGAKLGAGTILTATTHVIDTSTGEELPTGLLPRRCGRPRCRRSSPSARTRKEARSLPPSAL